MFRAQTDFTVVARCQDGTETVRAVRQHRPDVLLLDIRMPAPDGLQVEADGRELGLPLSLLTFAARLRAGSD